MTILPNPFPGLNINVSAKVQTTTQTNPQYKFKKAGKEGTLITVILDESGSMNSCRDTTIAGFNEFLYGQKNADASAGAGSLTLIKFDAPQIKTEYTNRPLSEVPRLDRTNYVPNGGTNLLDAIGTAINSVNEELSKFKKKNRPGVIISIMTDGGENSSFKFNSQQIKDMVKAAEEADWTFTFLGANIDSFAVGSTFGMSMQNTVNYSTNNMSKTMKALSASTTRMRSAKMSGSTTSEIYSSGVYTDDERNDMTK